MINLGSSRILGFAAPWLLVAIAAAATGLPDLPPDPLPPATDSFSRTIMLLRSAGRHEEALDFIREVQNRNGTSPSAWRKLAEDYIRVLEPIVALPNAERIRANTADSLALLIKVDWIEGHYIAGTDKCVLCLAIRREVLGPDHPDVALSLHDLGTFYAARGRYDLAEGYLEQALAARRRILGPAHRSVAETLHFLGEVRFDLGRYDEAQNDLVDALDIRRATLGEHSEEVDRDLLEIAQLHMHRGNLAAAEILLQRALRNTRARRGDKHWLIAILLANLAEIAEERGEPEAAEDLRRQVLDIRRIVLEPEHPHVARSLVDLGRALTRLQRFDKADSSLQEALALDHRYQDADARETVDCLRAIAALREASGDLENAGEIYLEVLESDRRQLGNRHPEVAVSLTALARLSRRRGDLSGANRQIVEALTILREALGDNNPALLEPWREQALVDLARGDYASAEVSLVNASRVFESARLGVGRSYARTFFARSPWELLAGVRLVLGREQEAWQAAEHFYGRALADLIWADGNRESTTGPLPPGRKLLITPPTASADVKSLAQIRAILSNNTALLGMIDGLPGAPGRGPWAFVIRRSNPLAWVELAAPPNESAAPTATPQQFLAELAMAAAWPFRVTDTRRIEADGYALWARWFAPLVKQLQGIDNLVLIPSGPLKIIPVEALQDAEGRYIVDRFNVSYIPSATIFATMAGNADPDAAALDEMLLVGNPSPDSSSSALPGARLEIEAIAALYPQATVLVGKSASERNLDNLASSGDLGRYGILHFATHALADDHRPDDSRLILYHPDLLDAMAAARSHGNTCDGLLTAGEIARNWRVHAQLVTLSSCGSARGRQSDGEGFIGLSHAFLRSGARSLVVSLWDVEDQATALLMSRFYQNLRGNGDGRTTATRAAALREAKLWLRDYRNEAGRQPFRHPAYWSAFVLVGEP